MKKKLALLFLIIVIIGYFFFKKKDLCNNSQAIKYKLGNKNYCLLVADSNNEWTKGLMNYKKPVNFDGMVFVFPKKKIQSFWNMNTYLDLDVYWLNDEEVVGKSFLPSIERSKEVIYISSPKKANKVIEIIK